MAPAAPGVEGRSHGRLEFLDALRGLAAGLVVFQHLFEPFPEALAWINFGRVGVICFFLISGFVIPLSLGTVARPGGFAAFWVGRFFGSLLDIRSRSLSW